MPNNKLSVNNRQPPASTTHKRLLAVTEKPILPSPRQGSAGIFIGLGSNLGNRRKNIEHALDCLLACDGIELVQLSTLIETRPVGGPENQAPYLNGAAEITCHLTPENLLLCLQSIETDMGRKRTVRWGPRIIDLDILLFQDRVIDQQHLNIPHPRMHQRRFVMEPLTEIAPHVIHPTLGQSMAEILSYIPPFSHLTSNNRG